MLNTIKKNRSLTFYQAISSYSGGIDTSYAGGISSVAVADTAVGTQMQSYRITEAFDQLQAAVIARGRGHAGMGVAQRGGLMAEDFVAETYNLDAVIKQADIPKAIAVNSNGYASVDVQAGDQTASLKFNVNAKSSAKAQLNPAYGDQKRIVPTDQLEGAKKAIDDIAKTNEEKGRIDVAKEQRQIGELLDDRIRGPKKVTSTPLSKQDDLDMAKAISKDKDGNILVDQKKIEKVMENTGVAQKVKKAVFRNELQGLGVAAAIGAGIGFTIGFAVTLAQSGVSPDSLRTAMASGAKAGAESGILSAVGYGIGRTIGQTAAAAITGMLENAGVEITNNITQMCNMGAVGFITITVFSVYQFVKLKLRGTATREALLQVGKQALFSLSLLAISIAIQGLYGGHAGTIVSISIGVVLVIYTIGTTVHHRKFEDRLRIYTIEKCKPVFA